MAEIPYERIIKEISQRVSNEILNGLLDLIDQLKYDFEDAEGGETWIKIDGHVYETDIGYAMDGVKAFAEILKERIEKASRQQN